MGSLMASLLLIGTLAGKRMRLVMDGIIRSSSRSSQRGTPRHLKGRIFLERAFRGFRPSQLIIPDGAIDGLPPRTGSAGRTGPDRDPNSRIDKKNLPKEDCELPERDKNVFSPM